MVRYLRPKAQVALHIGLLAASLLALPVIPAAAWKPIGNEDPVFRILGLLAVTIIIIAGSVYILRSSQKFLPPSEREDD